MGVHFARVQLVCECGGIYSTRQRGNTTKHRACGLARYVPFGQPWAGPPPSNRASVVDPGVWLECAHCLTLWEARTRPGAVVRCPECKHSKRVPTDPVVIDPAGWDTDEHAELIKDAYAEQGGYRRARKRARVVDDPEGESAARPLTVDQLAEVERKHERTRKRSGPANAYREQERQEHREQAQRERERERERFGQPRGDSLLVALGRIVAAQQGRAAAQPAQPRQAPRPRPARPARTQPARPAPVARQSAPARRPVPGVPAGPVRMIYNPWAVSLPGTGHRPTAEYLRAIGAPLSETSGTHAGCQFHSLRSGLPCDQPVAFTVTVAGWQYGACADHARVAEQRMAAPRPRG